MPQNPSECPPLPIFRPKEDPSVSTDCAKDEAARKMYAEVAPATAQIFSGWSTGSGFFVEDGSRVVTNAHVVRGQRDLISVKSHDGQRYQARIEKLDDINDLAVLRLENNAHNTATLKIGSSTALQQGAELYMLGHPSGRSQTYISPGTFEARLPLKDIGKGIPEPKDKPKGGLGEILDKAASEGGDAVKRDIEAYVNSERIDMNIRGEPGNSGSAVVDKDGKLVAIDANGAIVKALDQHAWSIPSETLQNLLDSKNNKFEFKYHDISMMQKSPAFTLGYTGVVSALTLGLPRVGGTIAGGISLLTAPSEIDRFIHAKSGNERLDAGLSLVSDAGFITGAVLAYFPRARLASRIATLSGISGMIGSSLVPRFPYLNEIKRTDGDTRPPILWDR